MALGMHDLLNLSPVIYALVCFLFLYRRLSESSSNSVNDAFSQLFLAIATFFQPSICPLKISKYNQEGCLYYPVGIYWLTYQIQTKLIRKHLFRPQSSISRFFPSINNTTASNIDSSLILIKLLSGVAFPLIVEILFSAFSCHHNNSLFGLIISIYSLIIIDSVFAEVNYSISTRNVGYFCFYLLSLIYLQFEPSNDSYFILFLNGLLLSIALITSQRGSQLSIALILSSTLISRFQSLIWLNSLLLACFILLQLPFANFVAYIKTHFYNRVSEERWRIRTYGFFRYPFFSRLDKNSVHYFLKDLLTSDFLFSRNKHVSFYEKRIFLSNLLTNRIYVYIGFFLLFNNNIFLPTSQPFAVFYFAGIIPFLLVYFRPFQGYGPGSIYTNAFLAPILISLDIQSDSLISSLLLKYLIIFEAILAITTYLVKFIHFYFLSEHSSTSSNLFDIYPDSIGNSSFIEVGNFFDKYISQPSLQGVSIPIMTIENHSQSLVELLGSPMLSPINNARYFSVFNLIDSKSYSFYDDYNGFSTKINLIPTLKPKIILLDLTKPITQKLLKYLRKENIQSKMIYKSSSFAVLKILSYL